MITLAGGKLILKSSYDQFVTDFPLGQVSEKIWNQYIFYSQEKKQFCMLKKIKTNYCQ